jgi:hypothetical protein
MSDATDQPGSGDPRDPGDVFATPARYGLEACAEAWGVFEFGELCGLYATRELAEAVAETWMIRWRALPPSAWTPDGYEEAALTIRELRILDRQERWRGESRNL